MLFQLLKKDLMKRKGVNLILFLFITLATVFLASSVNNILIVGSGVDYYLDYAKVPDINIIVSSEDGNNEIDNWLAEQKTAGNLTESDYSAMHILPDKSITLPDGDGTKNLDSKGASLYLGTGDADYNKVFDQNGRPFALEQGEIGLSPSLMERNGLEIGDKLTIAADSTSIEFTIAVEMKDAAFGSDMVGMSRLVVSKGDYETLGKDMQTIGLYYVMVPDSVEFSQQIDLQNFATIINVVEQSMYQMVFAFDMVMAGLLILIGVCLILIALLVLRFTLVFTMEEQYQEIGILKAIGLRNFDIKKLYLVKYLAIVSAGALLGLVISIPVSRAMIASVSKNMVMEDGSLNLGVNLLCALFIIALVLAFCYFCTRKLNKVSAITAIRGGEQGERYGRRKGFSLVRRSRMPVPLYLGCNDILSHLRRYAVLIITFCISFILITIPLNTLNTMTSREMVSKFSLDPDSSVYVQQIEASSDEKYLNTTDLMDGADRLAQELKAEGYDAVMTANAIFFLTYTGSGQSDSHRIMTLQVIGPDNDFKLYSEGSAPKLANEMAFSEKILEEQGWAIGDYVDVNLGGTAHRMLITGTYSDYMQLGKSAHLNSQIDTSKELMFDYWSVMVKMDTDKTQAQLAEELTEKFPDYKWSTAQQMVDQNVGGIQDMLRQMTLPMTGMLCLAIMLITVLMEKLFITREKGEIAMMKSIGFRYRTICAWQLVRMTLVVLASMVISVPLSLLSNQFLLKSIFAIMGADVSIQVNPLEVYLLYPGILLAGILLATLFAVGGIKRVDIREMNNLE